MSSSTQNLTPLQFFEKVRREKLPIRKEISCFPTFPCEDLSLNELADGILNGKVSKLLYVNRYLNDKVRKAPYGQNILKKKLRKKIERKLNRKLNWLETVIISRAKYDLGCRVWRILDEKSRSDKTFFNYLYQVHGFPAGTVPLWRLNDVVKLYKEWATSLDEGGIYGI